MHAFDITSSSSSPSSKGRQVRRGRSDFVPGGLGGGVKGGGGGVDMAIMMRLANTYQFQTPPAASHVNALTGAAQDDGAMRERRVRMCRFNHDVCQQEGLKEHMVP